MNIEELQADQAKIQAQLAAHQKKLDESLDIIQRAQVQAAGAQRQIDFLTGSLAQVQAYLERAQKQAGKSDTVSLLPAEVERSSNGAEQAL